MHGKPSKTGVRLDFPAGCGAGSPCAGKSSLTPLFRNEGLTPDFRGVETADGRFYSTGMPAFASRSAVSNSGNPMTPE